MIPVPRRDIAIAAGYAVLVIALSLAGIRTSGLLTLQALWPGSISLLLLLLACAGTLWRRRAPAVTLAVTGALAAIEVAGAGQIGAYLLLFDAVWAPVVHGSRRLARITTALVAAAAVAVLVGCVLAGAPHMGALNAIVLAVAVIGVVLATPLLWAWDVRHHAEARRAAEELASARHELAEERAARAVESERRRIAQDLHDVVAGHLAATSLHARLALSLPDPAARETSLGTTADSAAAALQDLRSVIEVLTGDGADAVPETTLGWPDLVRRLETGPAGEDRASSTCSIDPRIEDPQHVDAAIRAALLRIGAEAVTNALRHGEAPRRLEVRLEDDEVRLILENRTEHARSAGSDPGPPAAGLGLTAIADRARAVGGRAAIGPTRDGTWRIAARLPRRLREAGSDAAGDAATRAGALP